MTTTPTQEPMSRRMLLRNTAYCMIMPVPSNRTPSDSRTGETHTLENGVQMSTEISWPSYHWAKRCVLFLSERADAARIRRGKGAVEAGNWLPLFRSADSKDATSAEEVLDAHGCPLSKQVSRNGPRSRAEGSP
jgi:hypothetical protein